MAIAGEASTWARECLVWRWSAMRLHHVEKGGGTQAVSGCGATFFPLVGFAATASYGRDA